MIYLDYAASTPVLPEVKVKLYLNLNTYGNPSSLHNEGYKSKELIDEAKNIIANKLSVHTDELYFTSGATMSNNLIIQGFKGDVIYSTIEHEDIQLIAKYNNFQQVSVDRNGYIDLDDLRDTIAFCDRPTLVTIQAANSEIGTIQNIEEISKIVHSFPNTFLHMDMTQYIPYFEVNAQNLKIDSLSMSGQKIGCIKGTGLLYISNDLKPYIKSLIYGEQGLIGGTENVLGIACLGEAFECLDYDNTHIQCLRDEMINRLNGKLIGSNDNRLPNNICMYFENVSSTTLVMMLNEYNICASSGSACSSNSDEPSKTLTAIGLTPEESDCCVRFTVGKNNTKEEIDYVIETTNKLVSFLSSI